MGNPIFDPTQCGVSLQSQACLIFVFQVLMLSSLSSQWFLAGSSLIVVIQQIPGLNYSEAVGKHLEFGRANLAFVSALLSAFGMIAALGLKFVDARVEEKEKGREEVGEVFRMQVRLSFSGFQVIVIGHKVH